MIELLFVLFALALIFKFIPPKRINYWYGYRTPRSMKNIENWRKSNGYAPDFMLIMVGVLIALYFVLDCFEIDPKEIISKFLLLGFILLIIFTERKMR